MYGGDYVVLRELAADVFPARARLEAGDGPLRLAGDERVVAVFGQRWGKELRLPKRGGYGNYFVDWVLALIGPGRRVEDFVAAEVQTIDTTGNYLAERDALLHGRAFTGSSKAGLNWENVNKRILPQLMYKGNVLRRERHCTRGLFFICPAAIHTRLNARLGETLAEYPMDRGTITFRWYDLLPQARLGDPRPLHLSGSFTTTVEQLSVALDRSQGLPEAGVYEQAILAALEGSE
jgi:hypothetical protein